MFSMWELESGFLHAALIVTVQITCLLHILISKHENPQQASFWLLLVAVLPGFMLH